jgi:hypothetical protein
MECWFGIRQIFPAPGSAWGLLGGVTHVAASKGVDERDIPRRHPPLSPRLILIQIANDRGQRLLELGSHGGKPLLDDEEHEEA